MAVSLKKSKKSKMSSSLHALYASMGTMLDAGLGVRKSSDIAIRSSGGWMRQVRLIFSTCGC